MKIGDLVQFNKHWKAIFGKHENYNIEEAFIIVADGEFYIDAPEHKYWKVLIPNRSIGPIVQVAEYFLEKVP